MDEGTVINRYCVRVPPRLAFVHCRHSGKYVTQQNVTLKYKPVSCSPLVLFLNTCLLASPYPG